MKLIVGLGNPGRKYQGTRHNLGFEVVAEIARRCSAGPPRSRFQGEAVDVELDGNRCLLLCPHTFMNRSGTSVQQAVDFYKLELDDLLVVCDDMNLPAAKIRFRPQGSAGGQKGLADIIRCLSTESFARLRIGIGRPPENWDPPDYVLSKFPKSERAEIDDAIAQAAQAAGDWAKHDIQYCMNQYN